MLNEWVIAWVAHQAAHDPGHLFQANIFYPETNALAFSESMLVQSALAAPLLWAGASPVLAYNLVLMSGFVLTGWAMCWLVARWTGDWLAATGAGILMAFSSHALARLPHLQAQHVEFLPLILLSLDALLDEPRLRHAFSLAVFFALNALTSYYLFVMTSLALVAAVLARPGSWRDKSGRFVWAYLVLTAALSAVLLLPGLLPYWRASQQQGFTRSLEGLGQASWHTYLGTVWRFDYWLLAPWADSNLFPGFCGLALTGYAIARGAFRDPRVRMCLAFGACGVVLSLGPAMPGFALLYRLFLPLHGIRDVSRFGFLGVVAVAVASGYAVADLRRRFSGSAAGALVPAGILLFLVLEAVPVRIDYLPFQTIPRIYHVLDREPKAVVADLPLAPHQAISLNAVRMLNSTTSFYRLLNGYSGFIPQSYLDHFDAVSGFPSADSLAALRTIGVTHVFVHLDAYSPASVEWLRSQPGVRQLVSDGSISLFELLPARPAPADRGDG
jgi:hypothetical protein